MTAFPGDDRSWEIDAGRLAGRLQSGSGSVPVGHWSRPALETKTGRKPPGRQAGGSRTGGSRAGEGKAGEGKAGEGKAGEGKAGEGKAGEGRGEVEP
jgi:uncharacterized low-complexity protein